METNGLHNQAAERVEKEQLRKCYLYVNITLGTRAVKKKCVHARLTHLADTGNTGDHQFVVTVALHSGLTEEQVNLVIISLITVLTLWHLSHGNKDGL